MSNQKDQTTHLSIIFCLVLFGVVAVLLLSDHSSSNNPFFSLLHFSTRYSNSSSLGGGAAADDDVLGAALEGAAMEDKTLIIAMVNKAYVEEGDRPMLELFLDGFWLGQGTRELLNHLLIVAVDQTSYDRCNFFRLHCYRLPSQDDERSGEEKLFMSGEFLQMMWRRTEFLGQVLNRGYNFVFTDTDVLWLRNPFPRLMMTWNSSSSSSVDLHISTDWFNGNQWSRLNPINTGFYMVRSNNKTISLFKSWYALKDNSTGLKEQDVLQNMIRDDQLIRKLGIRVRFLDTLYFSGFCQGSRDIRAVSTVHANCCRTIFAKVADLKVVLGLWKRFVTSNTTTSPFNDRAVLRSTKHVACAKSWK